MPVRLVGRLLAPARLGWRAVRARVFPQTNRLLVRAERAGFTREARGVGIRNGCYRLLGLVAVFFIKKRAFYIASASPRFFYCKWSRHCLDFFVLGRFGRAVVSFKVPQISKTMQRSRKITTRNQK